MTVIIDTSTGTTLRAVTDAGRELLRQLADNGYITADAVDEFTPRLVK